MKFLNFFILVIFLTSCYNKQNKIEQQSSSNNIPPYISSIIKKFELPYNENISADSNTLFFYSSKSYDTSFLVHLWKENTGINGVFYEILPAYHKDDEDYADDQTNLLFFEGYSFKIDSSKWVLIINNARHKILIDKDTLSKNEACADCSFYFLSHSFKTITSNNNNRIFFENFEAFLKDSLLNRFTIKRQPKLHKSSSK